MPTEAAVLEALRPVEDPELRQSIVDLDMVKEVAIDGGRVAVTVALTVAGCPLRPEITRRVTEALQPLDGVESVDVDLETKLVVVRGRELDDAALRTAIEDAGYEAA
jgi:ATP-binding protein involved in chromosome partitioning